MSSPITPKRSRTPSRTNTQTTAKPTSRFRRAAQRIFQSRVMIPLAFGAAALSGYGERKAPTIERPPTPIRFFDSTAGSAIPLATTYGTRTFAGSLESPALASFGDFNWVKELPQKYGWGWLIGGAVGGLVGLLILRSLFKNTIVIVGSNEIALLERRWVGGDMPQGRVIAVGREQGKHAETLGPGLHLLKPFIWVVTKTEMTVIGENQIGLVESIDGVPVPPGRIFATDVEGHNYFQDAAKFLENKGQKGPQSTVLPPGHYRINPWIFTVKAANPTVIGNNCVGVVVAKDGKPLAAGQLLGQRVEGTENFQHAMKFFEGGGQRGPQRDVLLPGEYRLHPELFGVEEKSAAIIPSGKLGLVTARDGKPLPTGEYVAKEVENHNDFQDVDAFLKAGGQRGPQKGILKPGTYQINPLAFDVTQDEVLKVERGHVAVIVSNIGKDPHEKSDQKNETEAIVPGDSAADERLRAGQERYVVESGYRGIRREVFGPGTYYLNRLAETPHIIPTTNITIDWVGSGKEATTAMANAKARPKPRLEEGDMVDEAADLGGAKMFDPLAIVSEDGFEMKVDVKVIIRVKPEQAPYMVARVGTIENLIKDVIHPLVDSSFRNQASSTKAMAFMQNRHDQQVKAETAVREALAKYHVECVSVLICQILLPEELMNTLTQKVIAEQQETMYQAKKKAEDQRKTMEKAKADADQQSVLAEAEMNVKKAQQEKDARIAAAEGKKRADELEGEGKAAQIRAVGAAEAERTEKTGAALAKAYQDQVKALGATNLAAIEIADRIAKSGLKVTPDIVVNSGGNGQGATIGDALIAQMLQRGATRDDEQRSTTPADTEPQAEGATVTALPVQPEGPPAATKRA